jgi:hypothetical protein
MSNFRFFRNPEVRLKFLQLDSVYQLVFFNGFKTGVIQALRGEPAHEIVKTLKQLDQDYESIVAPGTNASEPGVREST